MYNIILFHSTGQIGSLYSSNSVTPSGWKIARDCREKYKSRTEGFWNNPSRIKDHAFAAVRVTYFCGWCQSHYTVACEMID